MIPKFITQLSPLGGDIQEQLTQFLNDDEVGADAVGFVKSPAIKIGFHAYSAEENEPTQMMLNADPKKRLITSPLLIPDQVIVGRNPDGSLRQDKWTKEVVMGMAYRYMKELKIHSLNSEHNAEEKLNGVHLVESYLSAENDSKLKELGFEPKFQKLGYENIPEGIWVTTYYCDESPEGEAVWQKVLDGTYEGVSIECRTWESPETIAQSGKVTDKELEFIKDLERVAHMKEKDRMGALRFVLNSYKDKF
jgi:hypothetical protein